MNANSRFARLWLVCSALFFSLACIVGMAPQPAPPAYVPAPVTDAFPPPTLIPTFTPTITFTDTPTNTALPPLPDFDSVLTFAIGGGGEFCGLNPKTGEVSVNVGKRMAVVCFREGFGSSRQIEWIAPDGRVFHSTLIGDGAFREYFMLWPVTLPQGQWQANIFGEGFTASAGFVSPALNASRPYLFALDPRFENEIIQVDPFFGHHSERLQTDGSLNVIGAYYPPNQPVYILIYMMDGNGQLLLIHRLVVASDSNGSIHATLAGLFETGHSYVLIGVADPNTSLIKEEHFNQSIPHDYFTIE